MGAHGRPNIRQKRPNIRQKRPIIDPPRIRGILPHRKRDLFISEKRPDDTVDTHGMEEAQIRGAKKKKHNTRAYSHNNSKETDNGDRRCIVRERIL